MKHGKWAIPKSYQRDKAKWLGPDTQRAWGRLMDKSDARPRNGVKSEHYLIAVARDIEPQFAKLCALTTEELEALRRIAEFESRMWCVLTAALAWQEVGDYPS